MIRGMAEIAAECVKNPGRLSIWSEERGEYLCVKSEEGQNLARHIQLGAVKAAPDHPPISAEFKMVFLTAVIGTVVFVALCLVLSLIAGKEPPPLFEKVILGFFDLAKIGFGAVVGLLGGKKLQGTGEIATT